ncbi:hypothetical protein EVAR_66990_1 [Eumeta japonica]|uniref:Sushi domain-containing protein n=1 Tax=Eumeta variegata TaxID=151549 RepID=A0A4C1ZPK6_EUMVA|nr:hypothetical protein EVAR_66990_1 [Eumeta japonica]
MSAFRGPIGPGAPGLCPECPYRRNVTVYHLIYLIRKQHSLCVLPDYPSNGTYTVVSEPDAKPGDGLQAVYLTYSCRHGHALVGSKSIHCINNSWTAEAPRCESKASTSITNKGTAPSTVLANTKSAWSYSAMEVTPQDQGIFTLTTTLSSVPSFNVAVTNSSCTRHRQRGVCLVNETQLASTPFDVLSDVR